MSLLLLQNDLLAVPAGPGRSVAYTLGMSNAPKVTNLQLLQTLFTNPKQLMPLLFRYACMYGLAYMCGRPCAFVRVLVLLKSSRLEADTHSPPVRAPLEHTVRTVPYRTALCTKFSLCSDLFRPVLCCVCVSAHRASFQRRPLYEEHLGMNKLFDQDNVSDQAAKSTH